MHSPDTENHEAPSNPHNRPTWREFRVLDLGLFELLMIIGAVIILSYALVLGM